MWNPSGATPTIRPQPPILDSFPTIFSPLGCRHDIYSKIANTNQPREFYEARITGARSHPFCGPRTGADSPPSANQVGALAKNIVWIRFWRGHTCCNGLGMGCPRERRYLLGFLGMSILCMDLICIRIFFTSNKRGG